MYGFCGVGCVRLSRCVWMRMVLDVDGEARCCRLDGGICMQWCWGRTARRVAVAWLIIFLFFACGGVGVTCIVEYWDVLHRGDRIFWKRNDDFLDLCRCSGLCGWWRMYYSGFIDLGNCYRGFAGCER